MGVVAVGVRLRHDTLDFCDRNRRKEAEEQEAVPGLTWATKSSLDVRRPFLVYYGDGPAYALIGQVTLADARTPIFQTADRALVEHLAFELQRELGILISV